MRELHHYYDLFMRFYTLMTIAAFLLEKVVASVCSLIVLLFTKRRYSYIINTY